MSKLQAPPAKFERGFLDRLDGRSSVAQIIREQWLQMTDDLGGAETLSLGQTMLIERALWMNYWLRLEEQKLAEGAAFDAGKVAAVTNTLQGVIAKLGLKRVKKDVPTLNEYLQSTGKQKAG